MNLPIMFNHAGNKLSLVVVLIVLLGNAAYATTESKQSEKATKPTTKIAKDNKSSTLEVSDKTPKNEKHEKTADKTETKSYPVNVSADQLHSQTQAGQSEYRGNVLLTRNKLGAHGDTMKLIHPNNSLQTATITGKPATFKDYLPKKQQWVNGEAKQIFFDQEKDTVTLSDNAIMIMDNGNRIKADKIIIYNKTETFEAAGSKQTGRAHMVIQPE